MNAQKYYILYGVCIGVIINQFVRNTVKIVHGGI